MWRRGQGEPGEAGTRWQAPCSSTPPEGDSTVHLEMHPPAIGEDLEHYMQTCKARIEDAAPYPVRCRMQVRKRPATVLQVAEYEVQVWVDLPGGVVAVVERDTDAFVAAHKSILRAKHRLQRAVASATDPEVEPVRLVG